MPLAVPALAAQALGIVGNETLTRVRRTEAVPARVQGAYQPPTEVSTTITGSVQPASGRDRQLLPEGKRGMEAIAVYTTGDLRTAAVGVLPDRLTFGGVTYEVAAAKPWPAAGDAAAFVHAVAVRLGD